LKLPAGEVPPGDIDLSGTGEPGVEVEVLVEGQVVGKTTVGSDGNWGLTIQLDEAGDYEVMVQALDSAGQVATASDPAVLSVIKPQAEATPTATATPAPAATPAPSGPEDGSAYIVQADDWLSKLAAKFYGDMFAYPVIVEATNAKAAEDSSFTVITNPDLIEIGQKVWIPNQP
jgi:LysM repeat protein